MAIFSMCCYKKPSKTFHIFKKEASVLPTTNPLTKSKNLKNLAVKNKLCNLPPLPPPKRKKKSRYLNLAVDCMVSRSSGHTDFVFSQYSLFIQELDTALRR